MQSKISIIIPVLNEESHIGKLLEHLLVSASPQNNLEIIIVDGGSIDKTKNIVHNFSNFHQANNKEAFHYIDNTFIKNATEIVVPKKIDILLFESKKGRAKQMNLGSKKASGDILYFLHADSFPPKHFDTLIVNEIKKGHEAGCFRMQFNSNHWWLKLASWFTQFNWRPCRGGDQSQFISKALFDHIGGFDEHYLIYEDNILIQSRPKRF